MLRITSLGSGSSGNATLVEAISLLGRTRLLVDCGFSLRETEARLLRAGIEPATVDALFITHEHGDHLRGALPFVRRHGCALWASRGTARSFGDGAPPGLGIARDGEALAIGALEIHPYTVPHDAAEPLQLSVGDGARRIGILTDAGMATPHMLRALQHCDALVLECNHDPQMLAASRYPPRLKARIASRLGHLANDSAREILAACRHPGLQHVVAAHLSESNNTPALARAALSGALGCADGDIVVADPADGFPWLDLR